jgi:ABC-type uncharacterized transport system substrate-binding protein
MRGESPGSIPFASVTTTRLIVNLEAAAAVGMKIPPVLVQQAQEVIR